MLPPSPESFFYWARPTAIVRIWRNKSAVKKWWLPYQLADRDEMEVVVRLHGGFRDRAGTDTIKVPIGDDETVDTLLMKLSRRYPKVVEEVLDPTTGDVRANYDILLNGRRILQIRGIHTKLKHKDEITISTSASV